MSRWFKRTAMGGIVAAALLSPAMAQEADNHYPMVGMMGGGCPVMGMGGAMMMGSGMMGPGMMPGYMPGYMSGGMMGGMPFGMMGWSGAGGSGVTYPGMMGGGRMMQNGVTQKGGAQDGVNSQMMAGGKIAGWPRMEAVVEGRLAYLRAELGITAAQNDAWNGYADTVRNHVSLMQDMHQRMFTTMAQGNAVDRMNARIEGMETMLSAMKAMQPAVEKLYKALSDDQKHLADQLIGLDCGGM
ncbi:MAG TPA: Spy/CpxP family protein refolding chaperone [Dongiaceae bacterium]|nr:Spy/CpxP family protein refolding chaperone [Dongiaceae bacterium]